MFAPNNVRAEMARHRVTIEELADRAKVSPSTVAKMLRPDANPTVETLSAVAKALHVEEAVFFANKQHYSADSSAPAQPLPVIPF